MHAELGHLPPPSRRLEPALTCRLERGVVLATAPSDRLRLQVTSDSMHFPALKTIMASVSWMFVGDSAPRFIKQPSSPKPRRPQALDSGKIPKQVGGGVSASTPTTAQHTFFASRAGQPRFSSHASALCPAGPLLHHFECDSQHRLDFIRLNTYLIMQTCRHVPRNRTRLKVSSSFGGKPWR